jgi:hypothetical protein
MRTSEDNLLLIVNRRIAIEQGVIDTFIAKVNADPYYAFTWGDSAVKASAQLNVLVGIKAGLESEKPITIDQLRKYFTDRVMNMSKNPEHSTSQMNNLSKQYYLAATAEMLEIIGQE